MMADPRISLLERLHAGYIGIGTMATELGHERLAADSWDACRDIVAALAILEGADQMGGDHEHIEGTAT